MQKKKKKMNKLLALKGFNYTDLAKKSGISRTQISRIINSNKNTKSNLKTIGKISNALGVDYKEIIKEE